MTLTHKYTPSELNIQIQSGHYWEIFNSEQKKKESENNFELF